MSVSGADREGQVWKKPKASRRSPSWPGVSTATVSRVINQNGRFSKETEERVLRVIRQNDYTPNMSAKGLRTSRTRVIGVVVPDITNPHFANVVLHLEMEFTRRGYSCLICNTNESSSLEKKHIRSLTAQNVSGIVLISSTRNYTELDSLPVVYVDRPSRSEKERGEGVMIESDNTQGATSPRGSCWARAAGISSSSNASATTPTSSPGTGASSGRSGRRAWRRKRPCASTSTPSRSTARARRSPTCSTAGWRSTASCPPPTRWPRERSSRCASTGFRCPRDVLVTGFDDCQLAEACGPGLTSVHQDVAEMSRLATELLFQMMRGERPERSHYRLPVTLTVRKSTRR